MSTNRTIRLSVNPREVKTKEAGEKITDFIIREFDLDDPTIEKELRLVCRTNVHSVNHWVGGCPKACKDQGFTGHSAKANYKGVWGLALDYDDGEISLTEAREKFKDYINIIYTSSGHRQDKPNHNGIQDRFRVILPFQHASDGVAMFSDQSQGAKYYNFLKFKYPEADHLVFDMHMKLYPFSGPNPDLYEFYLNTCGEWFSISMEEVCYHAPNTSDFQEMVQEDNRQMTRVDLQRIIDNCLVVREAINSIENNGDNEGKVGHYKRFLAANMVKHTIDDESYLLKLFSNTSDFDKGKTLNHYKSIDKKPITCRKLQEWKLCPQNCQLMKDIGRKSPIAFAYRKGVRLQPTEELFKSLETDAVFYELIRRIKGNINPIKQNKLISRLQSETGLRNREIQRAINQIDLIDDEKSYIVNNKVVPVKASRYIVDNYDLLRFQQDFYHYNDGIWKRLTSEELESLVHHEIGSFSCNYNINEIKNAIIRESLVPQDKIDQLQNKYVIAVKNGILDVRTKELTDFQKEHYAFKKMAAAYDSTASCPMFLGFLDELFKDDTDAFDKKRLVQEIFGYLLIPDYTLIKKMFYFYGNKADNGKSSLIEIIRNVFGSEYFDSVPMDKLDGFLLKKLKGKHANVVGDQKAHTKVPDGIIKLLIGGMDDITADVKHKDAINFVNTARLIFAVNRLPYSEAKDEGYFTRTVILTFNNQFIINPDPKNLRQMKANPDKVQQIKDHEKDGILNWMIEGLNRLLENKMMTVPKSSESALDEYKNANSSVLLFVREECELSPSYSINRKSLYDNYRDWCYQYGFRRYVNAHTLYDTLFREFDVTERRGKKVRFLDGIRPFTKKEEESNDLFEIALN